MKTNSTTNDNSKGPLVLETEAFRGRTIAVKGQKFTIAAIDTGLTMGLVIDAQKNPILGWSRVEDSVHVLALGQGWRGTDLEKTIVGAIQELITSPWLN